MDANEVQRTITVHLVTARIKSLSFGGGEQGVGMDKGGNYDQQSQWKDVNLNGKIDGIANKAGTINSITSNEHQYPISHVRSTPGHDTTMQVTVTFNDSIPAGAVITGDTNYNGVVFGPGTMTGQKSITLTANKPLPNTIDSTNLTITWHVAINGHDMVIPNTTTNHLYVTGAAAPDAPEEVLYVSCNAAVGDRPAQSGDAPATKQTDDQTVTDAVWEPFTTNTILWIDSGSNRFLRYNHTSPVQVSMEGLLKTGLGQCTAWAEFLVKCLSVEGEMAESIRINPIAFDPKAIPNSNKPEEHLLVKPSHAQGSPRTNYLNNDFIFHQVVIANAYPFRILDPSYGNYVEGTTLPDAELNYQNAKIGSFYVKYLDVTNTPRHSLQVQNDILDLSFES